MDFLPKAKCTPELPPLIRGLEGGGREAELGGTAGSRTPHIGESPPGPRVEGATPSWWTSTPVHMPRAPSVSPSPVSLSWMPHNHRNLSPNLVSCSSPRPALSLCPPGPWPPPCPPGSLTGHVEVDEPLILAHLVEDHTLVHGRHIGILDHQLAHRLGRAQAEDLFPA